jgi:hypothetical protein
MTTPDDDLRSMMHGAAESIDAGDLALADVRATANRRSLRRRVGAVVGVFGLVGAGVVAFVATGDSNDPETLVSADPTIVETPESTVAPDDTVDTVLPEATTPGVTVEVIQRPGAVGQPAGVGGAPQYGEWVVPWRDGFLVGAQASTPQPLPDELPEDIVALFPPEVVELFDGELPPTISEATAMLSEAGLLDVVADILAANPEASDAIYSVPVDGTGPALDVRFTTDGVTWEPVEMTPPPGADYLPGVTTVGDRLAVAYSTIDSTTGRMNPEGIVRVASTADLVNWDVVEVVTPPPPVTFPTGIGWSTDVAGFTANETGWVLSVHGGVSVDPEALIPADVRAELVGNEFGYGMSSDETGISIERTVDGADETIRYTWEELGVEPDVAAYLGDRGYEPQLWSSAWGATPTPSGVGPGYGQLVATSAGFLHIGDGVRFSPDGVTWATMEWPAENAFVSGSLVFDGGVVLLVSDLRGGTEFFRVDETGGSPVVLDVPGLPASIQSGYSATSREAIVIDASEPPPPPPPFVVEHDGHRLTVDNEDLSVEVVDVLTGEVVAEADVRDFGVVTDGPIVMDEAGLTVTDPETDQVVVVFTNDVIEAASEALVPADEYQYEPDLWLLASRDGDRFLLVDLDDGTGPEYPMIGAVASNGSNVLAQVDEEWVMYDLP